MIRGSYKMKVNSNLLQNKVVNKNHINLIYEMTKYKYIYTVHIF